MLKRSTTLSLKDAGPAKGLVLLGLHAITAILGWMIFFLVVSLFSPASHQYPVKEITILAVKAWVLLQIRIVILLALSLGGQRTPSSLPEKDNHHGK